MQSNDNYKYKVLSLFTGIGGMDMGFKGGVVVHRASVADDFVENIAGNSDTENFVNLRDKNFEIVFQNDILEGAKTICHANGDACNYHVITIPLL